MESHWKYMIGVFMEHGINASEQEKEKLKYPFVAQHYYSGVSDFLAGIASILINDFARKDATPFKTSFATAFDYAGDSPLFWVHRFAANEAGPAMPDAGIYLQFKNKNVSDALAPLRGLGIDVNRVAQTRLLLVATEAADGALYLAGGFERFAVENRKAAYEVVTQKAKPVTYFAGDMHRVTHEVTEDRFHFQSAETALLQFTSIPLYYFDLRNGPTGQSLRNAVLMDKAEHTLASYHSRVDAVDGVIHLSCQLSEELLAQLRTSSLNLRVLTSSFSTGPVELPVARYNPDRWIFEPMAVFTRFRDMNTHNLPPLFDDLEYTLRLEWKKFDSDTFLMPQAFRFSSIEQSLKAAAELDLHRLMSDDLKTEGIRGRIGRGVIYGSNSGTILMTFHYQHQPEKDLPRGPYVKLNPEGISLYTLKQIESVFGKPSNDDSLIIPMNRMPAQLKNRRGRWSLNRHKGGRRK